VGFKCQKNVYIVDTEGRHAVSPLLITTSKRRVNKYTHLPDVSVHKQFIAEEPLQAINTLKLALQNIVQGSGCHTFKVILTDEEKNFRDKIATIQPYKGNRTNFEKPVHWRMLRDWLLEKPYTIVSEGEEADDVVSRAMMEGHVGASNDKDLDNTPGWHYNFNKKEKYYVTEQEAIRNFYRQCLTGDTVDNIPGLKGIGPAKANNILGESVDGEDLERAVLSAYADYYEDPLKALTEVGQLLWMRRKEGELWKPLAGEQYESLIKAGYTGPVEDLHLWQAAIRLERLQEDSDWLDCLNAAGVDNWEGIEYAIELKNAKEDTTV
jgi:hypothetical protein